MLLFVTLEIALWNRSFLVEPASVELKKRVHPSEVSQTVRRFTLTHRKPPQPMLLFVTDRKSKLLKGKALTGRSQSEIQDLHPSQAFSQGFEGFAMHVPGNWGAVVLMLALGPPCWASGRRIWT